MYPNMFYCEEKIFEKTVSISLIPDFRQTVAICNEKSNCNYYTDTGIYKISEKLNRYGYYNVYADEEAYWFIEQDYDKETISIFVTEKTDEIITPFGIDFNIELNRMLEKMREEYYTKKKEEIRLYFYDSQNEKLRISKDYDFTKRYRYKLERPGVERHAIDMRYDKPKYDCFILGTVRKTIGLDDGMLKDYVKPLCKIKWNFKKDGDWRSKYEDFIFSDSYGQIEEKLLMLLKFTMREKYYNDFIIKRLRDNLNLNEKNSEEIATFFNNEIMTYFKRGNLDKLIALQFIMTERQDCKDKNFRILLKNDSFTCNPNQTFYIEYENGEREYHRDAKWVFENRRRCVNACCMYLGTLRGKYLITKCVV